MEVFLANLKVILPVVELDLLKPKPKAALRPPAQLSPSGIRFEIQHKRGVKATAVEEDGEFVVLEGSQALKDAGYQSNQYGELKQELITQGVLKTLQTVPTTRSRSPFLSRVHRRRQPSSLTETLTAERNGRWSVRRLPTMSGKKPTLAPPPPVLLRINLATPQLTHSRLHAAFAMSAGLRRARRGRLLPQAINSLSP